MWQFIMALSETGVLSGDINCTHPGKEESKDQANTPTARVLTLGEQERLNGERALVSDFKQMKLEKEAQKNWDLFYKRNTTNFFKDRHWTTREFEELKACREVRKYLQQTTPEEVHLQDIKHNICMF